jgi:hypothetical protein
MALNPAPLKAVPPTLADWVELSALANARGTFRLPALKRYWDTHRESEGTDSEGRHSRESDTDGEGVSGGDDDAFIEAVTDELAERSRVLGASYPYSLDEYRLELHENLNPGQAIYLFCLLLANSKAGDVLSGAWVPPITNGIRDLFQACSTVAAAAEVRGCAISFGWPRPNNNPAFLVKLHEVYARFGEGRPVNVPRPGAATMVKDEEIDVIAWTPRLDGAAGTYYLLGQVASGDNWECKSIKGGSIDKFHGTWFTQRPPSTPIPSIFIPHAVPPGNGGTRKDRMALESEKYGTILDRLRLPALAASGLTLAAGDQNLMIERVADIPAVADWVKDQITALRAAA